MITHIVMWKLKDHAQGRTKLENAIKMKKDLEALKTSIDGILKLEVGINVCESSQAYDVVLNSEFADQHALDSYQVHPDHVKVSDSITDLRVERFVVDYENT